MAVTRSYKVSYGTISTVILRVTPPRSVFVTNHQSLNDAHSLERCRTFVGWIGMVRSVVVVVSH